MTRSAWTLAAMADAAVPGLHPVVVTEVVDYVGEQFRVGFVDDEQGRRWVVRVPGDAVAAAQQDASVSLLQLLRTRLPFAVPEPAGFTTLRDGRRAMIYPVLPGRPLAFDGLPCGTGFPDTLGRAIAALHNVDRAVFDEAGVPEYDAQDCRRRRQADVDRGAQTGLVPTGLLARWEQMLDDVSWWRFAPTPVHGQLDDSHLLAEFDGDDSATGHVTAVTSWENAQIADPAQDLAALLARAPRGSAEAVLSAYAAARTELPDPHLDVRAGLLGELACLSDLLTARRLGDRRHVAHATQVLRDLDEQLTATTRGGNRSGTSIDRLPVDFEPAPAQGSWYSAGSGAAAPADASADLVYRSAGDSTSSAQAQGDRSEPATARGRSGSEQVLRSPATTAAAEHSPADSDTDPAGDTPTQVLPVIDDGSAPGTTARSGPAPRGAQPGAHADGERTDPRLRAHRTARAQVTLKDRRNLPGATQQIEQHPVPTTPGTPHEASVTTSTTAPPRRPLAVIVDSPSAPPRND